MKVLVTGGAGYIGSHTVMKLLEKGHEVVVYDNLSTGFVEALPAGVPFVHGDVRNKPFLSEIMHSYDIEAVVHFAAKLVVSESVQYPYTYYENNVLGSLSMLQACWENDVNKVVFSSTAAVYGNAPKSALVDEHSQTAPLNSYGHSKLVVEKMLEDGRRAHGLNYVALRYFNVAGAAVNGLNGLRSKNASHIIKVLAEAAAGKRKEVQVFGTDYPTPDGTCIRDYIHVEDLADLHVLSVDHLEAGGSSEIMNCGYGLGSSVLEVIESMKRMSGKDFPIAFTGRREGDATKLVADASKIQRLLRWNPKRADLDLICKTAYEWELEMLKTPKSSAPKNARADAGVQ
jgi:UDP-glucose 4-epimerase